MQALIAECIILHFQAAVYTTYFNLAVISLVCLVRARLWQNPRPLIGKCGTRHTVFADVHLCLLISPHMRISNFRKAGFVADKQHKAEGFCTSGEM